MSGGDNSLPPVRGVWTDSQGVTWARFDVSADISQAKTSDQAQLASDLRAHLIESAQRFVAGWLAITRGDSPEAVQAAINGPRKISRPMCDTCTTPGPCTDVTGCRRELLQPRMNGNHHPRIEGED
jgi:hypothetical protein